MRPPAVTVPATTVGSKTADRLVQVAGPCPAFGPALANSSDFPRRRSDPPVLVADRSRSATRINSQSRCWLPKDWDILRGPPAWSGDPSHLTSPDRPCLALRLQFLELSARLVRVEIVDGRPFRVKGDPRPTEMERPNLVQNVQVVVHFSGPKPESLAIRVSGQGR